MLILEYCTKQMESLLGYLILSFNVFKNLNHITCHEEQYMLILNIRGQQTLWKGPGSQYILGFVGYPFSIVTIQLFC